MVPNFNCSNSMKLNTFSGFAVLEPETEPYPTFYIFLKVFYCSFTFDNGSFFFSLTRKEGISSMPVCRPFLSKAVKM